MSPPASQEKIGFLRRLVRGLVRLYYPRIEITGRDLVPSAGPMLVVANHANSLIDPVLLGIVARRPIRLLAKAPLFELPVFGPAMRALGMVPAYRGSDDTKQVSKNLESLAAAARQLVAGHAMGIFPEGKSHDAAQLAMVRSGAARLAMQAVAGGASNLKIVPIGLNYEQKERFRSAVWVKVGRPIDATRWRQMHAGDEHRAMRALTPEIQARLRACVTHLDDVEREPLLANLEALLPPAPGGRRAMLATLHRRKRAADAINHFHRTDPVRAEAATQRVLAHRAALDAAGVPAGARLLERRGWRLALTMLGQVLLTFLGGAIGVIGLAFHIVPYGIVRLVAALTPGEGRMVVALTRLLLSLPVYGLWYALVAWRMSLYFLPWVTWAWLLAMPFAGLVAVAAGRRLRRNLAHGWAELRLLPQRTRLANLRAEHAALGAMLEDFATDAKMPTAIASPRSVIVRPPAWATLLVAALVLGLGLSLGAWLMRDRPIEVLRQNAPALQDISLAELNERMDGDERSLLAVIHGLEELEARFRAFDAALLKGERSYYRQADDEEIRRMLVSYLSFRAALLRTVWSYQRHAEIPDERARLRALLLHYTAAAVAYDYSARFVLAFDGRPIAIKKLNEAEPRWDLPEGTYDAIRANLAHVAHRQWLEEGWRNYRATLPRWSEFGLRDAEPQATFHRAIATAAENTARLSEKLTRYKFQTAAADVKKFVGGGWYRASAAVSTLIGDTKIREPRHGEGLVTPELLARLHPKLRPGDVLIERHNWFLSNAFLPGYWPHAALYVGTIDDLRALGLDRDPRVARRLEEFGRRDAAGHLPAIIESVSEGVIFSTYEHSVGESDSLAVLRPRLQPEDTKEVIARAFSHAGKPYDFNFDFFSADKLVCTELVYRSLGNYVDLQLVDIMGTKTLPALEIVRTWSTPAGARQLEFVAFLDGNEATGTCVEADADALRGSIGRSQFTWLQR